MLKPCRVHIERSGEVFEKIKEYRNKVIKELDPEAIILFRSFAKGDVNEVSDVDIVAVADFKQELLDRIKVLVDLNVGLPLEPVG